MRKRFVCRRVLRSVLALASAAFFVHSASGEESPYATGGEVTVRQFRDYVTSYIHVFTNTAEAASFASTGLRDLELRYLVVGAGGSGGNRYNNSSYGGGGGGGGGVCEKSGISFTKGDSWQVLVGKGATGWAVAAGASSISNGIFDVETVPGGGNGADAGTSNHWATVGASGGGNTRRQGGSATAAPGAVGIYTNSLFGVEYGPFQGGNMFATRRGSAGGGAGENGQSETGGEGLLSDITGEPLVYGSGGGGGAGKNGGTFYQGGLGGTRAGNGGYYAEEDGSWKKSPTGLTTDNFDDRSVAAADAEPNSGGGGGGALGPAVSGKNGHGKGADGIVVIRYDIYDSPCEGGDIVTKKVDGLVTTWIHQFTNVAPDASQGGMLKFKNLAGSDLKVRYLVVGAGGAGGKYMPPGSLYGGGGGGGGGGVCEKIGVPFTNGSTWQIFIGKGGEATTLNTMELSCGGVSAISNGVADIETVLGGGGGASSKSGKDDGYKGQDGASGGGGSCGWQKADGRGLGIYTNSLFGVEYGPFDGGKNNSGASGEGGGGASEAPADGSTKGGEGLVSDITGEPLVYGSGGGGGCGRKSTTNIYNGGAGGTRAGNGARYEIVTVGDDGTKTTNFFAATAGAANSGGGGGGGANMLVSGTATTFAPTPGADGIVVISYKVYSDDCPCEGGDVVTRTLVHGTRYIYCHYFTDTRMADQFVNKTDRDLKLRYLVVGAGGSGSPSKYANTQNSGAGGGGGGVCEKSGVPFAVGSAWQITVGKGAASYEETAGASSISNGLADVETVPGGGNAGVCTGKEIYSEATSGAAGGGGPRTSANSHSGAEGAYPSFVLGTFYGPFAGGTSTKRQGGGGGGAAERGGDAGTVSSISEMSGTAKGGEGLISNITGEPLVYGSGGGAGECYFTSGTSVYLYQGGDGGTRGGNGAKYVATDVEGETTMTYLPPTSPEPNSGAGGGGGGCNAKSLWTGGADGIVIIRYVYDPNPSGLLLMVR